PGAPSETSCLPDDNDQPLNISVRNNNGARRRRHLHVHESKSRVYLCVLSRSPTLPMYLSIAAPLSMPLSLAQASYLARPTMSSMPGRLPLTSPLLACLKCA